MKLLLAPFLVLALPTMASAQPSLDARSVDRFARLALACVHQEYPNKIAHVMNADTDAKPPRDLTPAFYGCYDWHSSVHGHWLLARLARLYPGATFAAEARAALERSLTPERVAAEVGYFQGKGRVSFERPYGLAWLLQLSAELREWGSPEAVRWADALQPLVAASSARLQAWLPKLTMPIRVGEHTQTAFSFGVLLDAARATGDRALAQSVEARSRAFYMGDRACPLNYEPSGQDFLSPCLAEADLMRRILPASEFAAWLREFLPRLPTDGSADWLPPGVVLDPSDPQLAHLDGLNLSRAWMLHGIAAALPPGDPRIAGLRAAAAAHRQAGLNAVTGEHYEGGHWLGTFAVYLETGRGLRHP